MVAGEIKPPSYSLCFSFPASSAEAERQTQTLQDPEVVQPNIAGRACCVVFSHTCQGSGSAWARFCSSSSSRCRWNAKTARRGEGSRSPVCPWVAVGVGPRGKDGGPASAQRPAAGYPAGVPERTYLGPGSLICSVAKKRSVWGMGRADLHHIGTIKEKRISERYRGHYSPLLFDRLRIAAQKINLLEGLRVQRRADTRTQALVPSHFPSFWIILEVN